MAQLTDEHISYILRDLTYRGLVHEGFRDEVLDHICLEVEKEMTSGKRFFDAYQAVLKSFGNTSGIRQLQHQVVHTKPKAMLKHYFNIALRNHLKNKFYTLINIGGLAVGIASCLIIMLFVIHELSYDRHHEKADRIVRVNTEIRVGSVYHNLALGSTSLAELFPQNYPEIESAVRLWYWGHRFVRTPGSNDRFKENVVWADSTFFKVFTVPLLHGDPGTALKEQNTIAISRKMAEKYFPKGNAIDQSLILDDDLNYRVTAVFEDIPDASHFHFDMIRSLTGNEGAKSASLVGGSEVYLYLLLRKDADARQLEAKFPSFVNKYVAPQIAAVLQNDFTMEKFASEGNIWRYSLTPLIDIHLHSDLEGELEANGSITYVYLFSSIAVFILVIASINFMNLSTARSADRAREVGIRKVMGSLRLHLIRQFLMESFVLTAISFLLALGIAHLFIPVFNVLAQKDLSLPWDNYSFYTGLVAATLLVGVLAGLYPSFFLSAFKPVTVLKGKLMSGSSGGFIRSGLVVFQFVISIFLIIATITIQRQLSYIQNKKIGFEKEQVVVVHNAQTLGNQLEAFKEEVLRNSFISSGTISGFLPVAHMWRNNNTFWPEGKIPTGADVKNMISMQIWDVDYDYMTTLGMKLRHGRNFSREFPSDSVDGVILNEAAIQQFGFGPDPIEKKISFFSGNNPDGTPDMNSVKVLKVIGVVENFHYESMRENIAPLSFILGKSNGSVSFRYTSENTASVVDAISGVWKKMVPHDSFHYSFLDEDFGKMYDSEERLGTIFGIFAALAIVIASLGLFALTSFMVRQRTKEIGIRKTLGASLESIVLLLSKTYFRLIFLAFVLSVPLSWMAVNWWLQSYSYKAQIGVMVYALAGAATFVIAMLTVYFQSIRAASINPASTLRSE